MLLSLEYFIYTIVFALGTLIPTIIAVAFFTLSERNIMAFIQRSEGPNATGVFGVLQPLADGLKLLVAEPISVMQAAPYLYMMSATLPFIFGLMQWSVIPLGYYESISNSSSINILYLFPFSLGGVYGVMLSGWASNSNYSSIGSFSSIAQLISYDIPFILSITPLFIVCGSLNITEIGYLQSNTLWFFFLNIPAALVFFMAALAETNSAPFDLPEAEAELVAGFNVEYSAMFFALFFLGEYSSMLLISLLYTQLFFGEDSITSCCMFIALLFVTWNVLMWWSFDGIPYRFKLMLENSNNNIFNMIEYGEFEPSLHEVLLSAFCLWLIDYNTSVFQAIGYNMLSAPPFPARCIFATFLCLIDNILWDGVIFTWILNCFSVVNIPYSVNAVIVCMAFIVARAVAPSYSYDQLMNFCWKALIPLSLSNIFMSLSLLTLFNGFISNM